MSGIGEGGESQTTAIHNAHGQAHSPPSELLDQRIQQVTAEVGEHKSEVLNPSSGGGGHTKVQEEAG